MPPNPRRNAQIAILVDMSFTCTKETKLIPFVSSIIPDNIGTANERFILKKPTMEKSQQKINLKYVIDLIWK